MLCCVCVYFRRAYRVVFFALRLSCSRLCDNSITVPNEMYTLENKVNNVDVVPLITIIRLKCFFPPFGVCVCAPVYT